MAEMNRLNTTEDFQRLKKGDEIIVVWNPEGEIWSKEMEGRKMYKILYLQRGNSRSPYPDEVILRKKENIFFNFRFFLNGESKIVKEVFLVNVDALHTQGEKE